MSQKLNRSGQARPLGLMRAVPPDDDDAGDANGSELSQRLARAHVLLRELTASASAPLLRVELDKLKADLEAADPSKRRAGAYVSLI